MAGATTRNLTILLTDIEDFTPKTSRKTRADILRMLEEHKGIVLPVLEGKGGRLIKTIGDAFLVVFDSPTDAVLAGVEVQRLLREHNAHKLGDDRLDVRIAINAGEVTLADNDVFGEPVNITARINGIAEAGEVFFTEAVYLAMNKMEVPSSEVGLLQLKGIAEKIRVYKVVPEKRVGATSGEAAESSDTTAEAARAASSIDAHPNKGHQQTLRRGSCRLCRGHEHREICQSVRRITRHGLPRTHRFVRVGGAGADGGGAGNAV
jgi:class 3 adenylate cyclase